MPIPLPPETKILERVKSIITALPLKTTFGLDKAVTVRHERHRRTNKEEVPGVAIRYLETEIDNESGSMHTSSEQCWVLSLELVVDLGLLPEKSIGAASGDFIDATGWDRLLGMAHYCAGALVAMDSPLRTLIDDVEHGDVAPDEDSQPDQGRLARRVNVLYRTLYDDPLHLLSPEENA